MGTRADFYVGKGKDAEWIGSVAWDGYEWGERIAKNDHDAITSAANEADYRKAVAILLASRNDGTTPEMGWPWPWNDSCTTDCSYCLIGAKVEAFSRGREWADEDGDKLEWPNFSNTEHSAKAGSNCSGIMAVSL
jgi:hypothetical protein